MLTVDLLLLGPSNQREVVLPTANREGNIVLYFRLEIFLNQLNGSLDLFHVYSMILRWPISVNFQCTGMSKLHVRMWNIAILVNYSGIVVLAEVCVYS